ncbi:hypothetical protein ACRRS0_06975 [Agarivorans sp. QJM3NY_29]|uniref:hypothetical protein n=1 Tax=unclassified Agarivorans TaxID=2636026 RepID=UPI003D7C3747
MGKYEITQNGTKSYISFKGNHKLRTVIKGTRYLSTNTKMLNGLQGLKSSARGGVYVTVLFSVTEHSLELVLKKNYLMSNWVADVSTDVAIAAVAAVCGFLVGAAIAPAGVVMIPVAVGFVVAFAVGTVLSMLADRLGIKKQIVEYINRHAEQQAQKSIVSMQQKIEQMKVISSMNNSTYKFL